MRKPQDLQTEPRLDDQTGALLLPPKPPPAGTVRLLLPEGSTWSMRQLANTVQLDIVVVAVEAANKGWATRLRELLARRQ